MLNPLNFFSRPEYLFRPRQIIRRFQRIGKTRPELLDVKLPWGAVVTVHTGENIGAGIYYYGIYDKVVSEAIWRLLDHGEIAVDVGANIGQNCSLMAVRAGVNGRVLAFEPHPEIFGELKRNYDQWQKCGFPTIQFESVALGKTAGETTLVTTEEFSTNRGSAALANDVSEGNGMKVQVRQLDKYLGDVESVGVCKIDVEGHELAVLQGAEEILRRRGIRDIVFEDFHLKPSVTTEFLQQHGFTVFELHDGWLKPRLIPLRDGEPRKPGFMFNYLATLNVARTLWRFRVPGWRCLLGW
jgi:FkbM family methyltransferase